MCAVYTQGIEQGRGAPPLYLFIARKHNVFLAERGKGGGKKQGGAGIADIYRVLWIGANPAACSCYVQRLQNAAVPLHCRQIMGKQRGRCGGPRGGFYHLFALLAGGTPVL
jgi:hypothetical protein